MKVLKINVEVESSDQESHQDNEANDYFNLNAVQEVREGYLKQSHDRDEERYENKGDHCVDREEQPVKNSNDCETECLLSEDDLIFNKHD